MLVIQNGHIIFHATESWKKTKQPTKHQSSKSYLVPKILTHDHATANVLISMHVWFLKMAPLKSFIENLLWYFSNKSVIRRRNIHILDHIKHSKNKKTLWNGIYKSLSQLLNFFAFFRNSLEAVKSTFQIKEIWKKYAQYIIHMAGVHFQEKNNHIENVRNLL